MEIRNNNIGYLEIMQFGDTTAQEALGYLEEFKEGRTLVDYYDCEEYTSMRTSESEPYYEITYYKDKEILIQETYFMYN